MVKGKEDEEKNSVEVEKAVTRLGRIEEEEKKHSFSSNLSIGNSIIYVEERDVRENRSFPPSKKFFFSLQLIPSVRYLISKLLHQLLQSLISLNEFKKSIMRPVINLPEERSKSFLFFWTIRRK